MKQEAEENPVSKYFRKQNGGKSAVELLDNEFSSMYVIGFAEMYYEKRLKELKGKAEARVGKVEALLNEADETEKDVYLYCLSELKPIITLIEEELD